MSAYKISLPIQLRTALRFCVGGYCLFIIWASLRPAGTGGGIPHLDKLLHFLVYMALGISVALAWPKLSKFRIFWGCVVFGAAMETAQGLMEAGRSASILDGLANSLGTGLGIYIMFVITRKFAG